MLTTCTTAVDPAMLEDLVDRRQITAITFDAGLFGHYGFGFSQYPLSALKNLADKGIQIILSDIVMDKMQGHFHELAKDTLNGIRGSLRMAESLWQTDKDQNERFHKLIAAAEKRIDDTFRRSMDELHVLTVNLHDYAPASDAKYARTASLLEPGNCNKFSHIILKSLSAWAQKHDTHVLVVSRKPQWLGNCAGFGNLHGLPSLKDALALFHKECRPVAHDAIRYFQSDDSKHIFAELHDAFREAVRQSPLIPGPNARGYTEGDINAVELMEIDYGFNSTSCLIPVKSSDSQIIFMLDVDLRLEVYAHLPFYRQEQSAALSFPQDPGVEVLEAKQQGSIALIFTRMNGRWKYFGHEEPSVRESMAFIPLESVSEGALEPAVS